MTIKGLSPSSDVHWLDFVDNKLADWENAGGSSAGYSQYVPMEPQVGAIINTIAGTVAGTINSTIVSDFRGLDHAVTVQRVKESNYFKWLA